MVPLKVVHIPPQIPINALVTTAENQTVISILIFFLDFHVLETS